MKNDKLSRRDFFVRATAVGAVTVGSGTILAACGGGDSQSADNAPPPPANDTSGDTMASADCTDVSALTDAEKQTRTSLQYVDQTANPDQRCDNCQLYVAATGDSACGTCQIIKGPINPAGYCISWAAVQA